MDGKNKIGFVQKCQYKLAAILNVISNDLTTDAVPDKKYHEKVKCGKQPQLSGCEETSVCSTESTIKPCTELILKENKNDKKKSENIQKHNVSCEDDEVYNMKGKPKKSDFSFGQTKNKKDKSNDKRRQNYIENKKVFNISHSENIHIGNSYVQNIGFNSSDNERKRVQKTPEIIDMMQCKDIVATEHILEVAPHVGKNWKTLGRHLKFSDGQLEQLQDNNKNNLQEVVSELLRDWIELETDNATIGLLCQYMWKSNEKIAVEKLVAFVNKESKNKKSDKK